MPNRVRVARANVEGSGTPATATVVVVALVGTFGVRSPKQRRSMCPPLVSEVRIRGDLASLPGIRKERRLPSLHSVTWR